MEKFKVTIDKDLIDIIPEYIEHRKQDCITLKNLLEQKNFSEIKKIGHKMAGSGGGYGFDEISRIGKEIENKAENSPNEILQLIEKLENYLDNLEISYE